MQILKNLNLSKKIVIAVIALIAGVTIVGKTYLKSDKLSDLPQSEGEVASIETQVTETPTPAEEPTAITTKEKQSAPTGTPTSTNTPTPKQESTYQPSTNTPTPYPTTGNVQGGSTYNQEAIDAMWDYYDKRHEEFMACIAERNALTQPLQDQIYSKRNNYDELMDQCVNAVPGKEALRYGGCISKYTYLLSEMADLQEQINDIHNQYPCN